MNDPLFPSHGACMPLEELQTASSDWCSSLLGGLYYATGSEARLPGNLDIPMARVATAPLGDNTALCETWREHGASKTLTAGPIQYRATDHLLFGVITVAESDNASDMASTPLQHAAEAAYQQIFGLLDEAGYPHLVRCWNYLADINGHSFGLERYRQFNLGRQDAFLARGRDVEQSAPAACALGAAEGPLVVAFLGARSAPINIENPRQVSAFAYPETYGPRSPTFSRASLLTLPHKRILFLSGTASIVGHATCHAGDVLAQTRETVNNIRAVIDEANRRCPDCQVTLADLQYKVYVRHSDDIATVKQELGNTLDSDAAVFLQADICRDDLLVEIEATAEMPPPRDISGHR